jgi:hypothetical protein
MPAIVTLPDDGWAQITKARCTNPFPTTDTTAIADSGARDSFYLTPAAPVININPSATKVAVDDAAGTRHRSSAQADIQFNLPSCNAKIMPSLQHNLMGIGKLCDNDCKVVFDKTAITVIAQNGSMLLKDWHEQDGSKLWQFSLFPNDNITPT